VPVTEPAWHERTSTLLAASVGAVAVIAVVYFLVSALVGDSDGPGPAQQYFTDTTTSISRTPSTGSPTTTTGTMTSTSPPMTTDINDPNAPPPPPTPGTETSGTETPPSEPSTTTRTPRTTDDDDPTSTRSRPRLNETRTLYPRP
jgi:type IV secretory pathway VirB10-like protein